MHSLLKCQPFKCFAEMVWDFKNAFAPCRKCSSVPEVKEDDKGRVSMRFLSVEKCINTTHINAIKKEIFVS